MSTATIHEPAVDSAADLAAEAFYRLLALCLADPRLKAGPRALDPASRRIAVEAAAILQQEYGEIGGPLGYGELPADKLDPAPLFRELDAIGGELATEYSRVFGLVSCRECPPYETEYHLNEDTFFRSQQMADVAGFYRAFGLASQSEPRERPDYLPLELEFAAFLLFKQRAALSADDDGANPSATICRDARRSFLQDHLVWWVPSFALALVHKAEHGFYAELARLLAAFLPIERIRLGLPAPINPQQPRANYEPAQECDGCLVELKT